MKKFTIIIALLVLSFDFVYASPYQPTLDKIENVLYGYQYSNESDDGRLKRIEESIYGKPSSGDIQSRMNKLKKDISSDLIGKEITPCEDTFQEEIEDDEYIAESPNVQYPAVDELEKKVFNKTYTQKEIKQRLSALEEKTFGKTYNDNLANRVDRLKAEIKPNSFMNNSIAQSSNSYFDQDEVIPLAKDYYLDKYDNGIPFDYEKYNQSRKPIKTTSLNSVENKILKHSYQNEPMDNRLSRLENAMFGTEFSDDTQEARISRIQSAYNAQKSSAKYDSNKFTQNMATAFQIGTLILMVLACIL